jgi:hypothetical protein
MKCDDVMELMQRHLDFDLGDSEEQAMLAHLQGCPDCADLYERLKLLSRELAQLPKVSPPYSIVDSILPRLEGLGGMAEPSAASAVVEQQALPVHDELAARREKKGLISWKIVSGVAAAGLVLGMFIFNGNGDKKDTQLAESLLSKSESPAAMPAADANAKRMSGQDNDAAAAGGLSDAIAMSTPVRAPTASNGVVVPSLEASGTVPSVKSDRQVSTGGKDTLAAPGQPTTQAGSSQKLQSPAAGANATATDIDAVAGTSPSATESSPASDSAEAGTVAEQGTKENSFHIAEKTAAPSPGENSAAAKIGSNAGFAPGAAASSSFIDPVVSPDGVYTSVFNGVSVQITDQSGVVLFESARKLAAGDVIQVIGWESNTLFKYSIKSFEGVVTVYQISAADLKETVQ